MRLNSLRSWHDPSGGLIGGTSGGNTPRSNGPVKRPYMTLLFGATDGTTCGHQSRLRI